MLDKILQIEEKYKELGITLSDPAVIQDYERFRDLSKQRKAMEETVEVYQQWKANNEAIEDAKELIKAESDEEMKEFLKSEIETNEKKNEELSERMKVLLLPRDPMDDKDIMLEIRGSAGGDEANIFAGDLMRMYLRFADKQGWQTQILSMTECEAGGVSEVIISIKGDSIYSKLKYESGVHRVQRVPQTESQGRVHTSTATVAVMPEVDDVEIELNPSDLEISTARSGGAGGQRLQDHLLLAAEGTTHGGLDDPDVAHGHAKDSGDGGAGTEDGLSGGPDGHPIGGRGVVSHSAVGLHGDVAHPLGGGVMAELLPLGAGVVPIAHQGQTDHAILLVDGAGVLGQGLLRVKDGG